MPNSWRDHILQAFAPQVARLTLVADPDGLLIEEGILQELQTRGYELLSWNDPVAFRFIYEMQYRTRWDQNESAADGLILRTEAADLHSLPYDLLQTGRHLTFTLGELFPNLSSPVVATLDRGDFDALFRAQHQHHPGKLGDNATRDFILRHVFDVASELIKEPTDLLHVLLRRHYRKQHVPTSLNERLIQLLQQDARFQEWPLEHIVPDREAFFGFLQERWPHFVRRWLRQRSLPYGEEAASEVAADPAPGYMGLIDLPFDHDDVRVYIDNLFLEGSLQPYAVMDYGLSMDYTDLPEWLTMGLRIDLETDRIRRVEGLFTSIAVSIPSATARHNDWLAFAHRWAELLAVWHRLSSTAQLQLAQRFQAVRGDVDTTFLTWVQQRYGGLHNLPAAQPAMLHHIPRYLARELDTPGVEKIALVVLDGLACDQWVVLREVLIQRRPQLHYQETAVFAWIPTITSVSRQAVFAGKPPVYYPGSIHRTDREAALWTQFWSTQGLSPIEVAYARGLSQNTDLLAIEACLTYPRVRVVGLVIDAIDKIMHGMTLGTAGMHNQVRQWTEEGFLAGLFDLLSAHAYTVFLTSDHGNIECMGCGRPSEGAVADMRGEWVRVYPNPALRAHVQARFPEALAWPSLGLPDNYFPLLAPGRSAFVQEGARIVGHGGITLEELIVPFIRVERRDS